jgi:hypothetical protein
MTAGLAGATALRGGGHESLLVFVGGLALLVLLTGLVARWSAALAFGIALLGAQQAVRLSLGTDALDSWAPLSAGVLLLVAELAWWSIEPRVPASSEPWLALRRLGTTLLVCACGSLVAAVVLVAAGAQPGGGFAFELVGVAAATAALAVVALVARTRSAVD